MSPGRDVKNVLEAAKYSSNIFQYLQRHELDKAVLQTERLHNTKVNLDENDREGLKNINANTIEEFAEYAIKRGLTDDKPGP